MPSKICGAESVWVTEVVPVGVPLTRMDGATRGAGVVVVDVTPGSDEPTAFVATTENLYGTPFVKPFGISQLVVPEAGIQVTGGFSGCPNWSRTLTTYPVIVDPLALGAVNEIEAPPSPAVAVTPLGTAGGPIGVIELVAVDGREEPTLFDAVAVNV